MKDSFENQDGESIVFNMIETIQKNAKVLSEIDGAIGDGDHGINMSKGFTICKQRLEANPGDFAGGLRTLGRVLMAEIGGAMGPLYGTFFLELSRVAGNQQTITRECFQRMLESGSEAVMSLGNAKVGDKTMVDTLVSAVEAYRKAAASGADLAAALAAMATGAAEGKESTRNLVAKVGRASRLGERSRGIPDAGATSCALLLESMARSIRVLLAKE
ncbi:MAG TPA: dihydroxyacetone kinase subunit DhaL [Spirochaetia bacterium]|nr:dihydroxyacetone kinase subunit DhaL [Spirochaetia bacterium]